MGWCAWVSDRFHNSLIAITNTRWYGIMQLWVMNLPLNVSWGIVPVWRSRPLYVLAIILRLQWVPPSNCRRVIGLAMPDQIKNHWWGDDKDCEDTGLYARVPAILNTHEFNSRVIGLLTCNRFLRILAIVKFWRVKLWWNKGGYDKFAKVLHHQRFPLYSIVRDTTFECWFMF